MVSNYSPKNRIVTKTTLATLKRRVTVDDDENPPK